MEVIDLIFKTRKIIYKAHNYEIIKETLGDPDRYNLGKGFTIHKTNMNEKGEFIGKKHEHFLLFEFTTVCYDEYIGQLNSIKEEINSLLQELEECEEKLDIAYELGYVKNDIIATLWSEAINEFNCLLDKLETINKLIKREKEYNV